MDKLKTLEKVVLEVLEDIPEARDDDFILLLEVCKRTDADVSKSFLFSMLYHKDLKIPNWKSVERCRRKIQAQRPDLISPEAAKKRRKAEETYTKYSRAE